MCENTIGMCENMFMYGSLNEKSSGINITAWVEIRVFWMADVTIFTDWMEIIVSRMADVTKSADHMEIIMFWMACVIIITAWVENKRVWIVIVIKYYILYTVLNPRRLKDRKSVV